MSPHVPVFSRMDNISICSYNLGLDFLMGVMYVLTRASKDENPRKMTSFPPTKPVFDPSPRAEAGMDMSA